MTRELVGRDREVAGLLGWVSESAAGSARVVLVAGDAGIGKSRLASAVADVAAPRGMTVAWGRTTEVAGAPPFRPWRQVLHHTGASELLDPVASPDPTVDRLVRFDAIAAHFAAIATRNGGLLIVLEDVHRADEPSLSLLRHLAESITAAPLCIFVTHRDAPGDRTPVVAATLASVARLPSARRLRLGPLGPGDVAELLGDAEPDVVDRVFRASGGNPLFVSELSRHLRAGGDLDRVPATVIDAVRARLLERSDRCVTALQVAAVIGRNFSAALVARTLDWSSRECLDVLEEAVESTFIEDTEIPDRFRFVHIVVRDAVEATLRKAELADANRRVAEAIAASARPGDDVAADLARHWQAAAALGYGTIAADWCERAAQSADRRMAWEDAARFYERAVELAGTDADPIDRHRRLVNAASARLHCDDITEAVDRCRRAADSVRHLGRGDLLATAALVVEGRGGPPLAQLRDLASEALASDGLDAATRARLLGQLAACAFYLDPSRVESLAEASLAEAEASGDALAMVAAARARQMALAGPDSASERLRLATVIGEAGRALERPSVLMWEPIWRIDALVELGRLPDAVNEVVELRRRVEAVPVPVARWHLLRIEALLAQGTGRFDDALTLGRRCCDLFGRMEDPAGGQAMFAGFRSSIAMHTGFDQADVAAWDEIDLTQAPSFLGDLPVLGPLFAVLGVGDIERARSLYERLAPVSAWSPPLFLRAHLLALRLWAAKELHRFDEVDALIGQLAAYKGAHIAAGAGGITYSGPVELWTGVGSLAIGRLDDAVVDLQQAGRASAAAGAPGFAVQANVELARALCARTAPADAAAASAVLADIRPTAVALGMVPWVAAIDELQRGLTPAGTADGPLSPRELEVAALVAEGLTNRAIAERLFVSERTAQNHVQHILTKLGVANRAQIAAWFTTR